VTTTMASVMSGLPLPSAFLSAFRDAMERLADGPLAPALDLYTTPDAIIAHVALPGAKREDVDITVGEDLVTIRGSVQQEQVAVDARYVHKELNRGLFSRSFWLPTGIETEGARVSLKDGLLTLTLPKRPNHVTDGPARLQHLATSHRRRPDTGGGGVGTPSQRSSLSRSWRPSG
jgi:HSP20 family molecular chaperone IbpA